MTKLIRSLTRGINVIDAMNQSDTPMSLNDIHQTTGLDRATLLRILATLEDAGWVHKGIADNCYRITYQMHELGMKVSIHDALAQIAAPVLEQLQTELVWPSDIAVYNGTSMEIVETTRKKTPFVINREIMSARPDMLQSAIGRVYLAFCPEPERQAILQRLRKLDSKEGEMARNEEQVDQMLSLIQHKGYAERKPGYWDVLADYGGQVNAIAVPVLLMEEVQATVNLVWLTGTCEQQQVDTVFYPRLEKAAQSIADELYKNQLY